MSSTKRSSKTLPLLSGHSLFVVLLLSLGVVTLSLRGVDISSIVASATSSLARPSVTLFLTPYDDTNVLVGEVKKVDVTVNADVPINAIGVTIKFPKDALEILGFSKEKSFLDLWTEETAIQENAGEIHFSGGTTKSGGMTGTSTVLTIIVRAKKIGEAKMFFSGSEVYAANGKGTQLENETRPITFSVTDTQDYSLHVRSSSDLQPEEPLPRTPDVNTDGVVNLVDVSIMIMRLVMPYDYHFDLNMDGAVNVADASIVLSFVR